MSLANSSRLDQLSLGRIAAFECAVFLSSFFLLFFGGFFRTQRCRAPDIVLAPRAELIDIIVESGATLFVSAVGVPPRWVSLGVGGGGGGGRKKERQKKGRK